MEKYFRWIAAKRENGMTVHASQAEQPKIALVDVIKVMGAAGAMVWGAAVLANKLDMISTNVRDHEMRLRPIETRLTTIDTKLDMILDNVSGRKRNGSNYQSRPPR